ncbi:MAG: hypothetical protein DU480_01025 [Nitrosomonas sp.]|uniref:tetratricopeptide repeat protein n=1 Tax=Nitrosomonas sp. TaxID=42353 RepID=UPI0032F018A9
MTFERLQQSLEQFNKLLPALGVIFTIVIALAAWALHDIQPLHLLKRIVAEQQGFDYAEQQRQFQQQVVANHVALGQAFLDDQLYDQAGDEFGKALAIDKLHVDAQIGRFIVEAARQIKQDFRPQAVERQLDFLRQQQPDNPYVHILFGDLAVQREDLAAAKQHYEAAMQSGRQPAAAYFGMGYWHEIQSNLTQALVHYQKAVERSPWNQRYLNNLAGTLRKLGQYPESIDQYEKILTLDRDYLLAHVGIAQSYAHSRKLGMAMRYLEQFMTLAGQQTVIDQPKNQAAWNFHGTLLETPDEKRQYALYQLGLMQFLLDQQDDTQRTIQAAQAIKTGIGTDIQAAVAKDIALLDKANAEYTVQTGLFKQLYLQ